jgi:hypothetical protein
MSNFKNIDFDRPRRPAKKGLQVWDILSIGVLLVTACIGLYFLVIYLSPNIFLNPFSPKRLETSLVPTYTITPLLPPPTWTPTSTPYIPPTDTPRPTFTEVFTPTSFSLVPPTRTPRPTATPRAPYSAKVDYISSSVYHPEFGCNWLGVAGIVLDKNNAHHYGLQVILAGTLDGHTVNNFMISGMAPQLYGTSGFEVQLGNTPLDSTGTLYLQLRDQGGGVQLSENIYFNTYSDCSKNMVYVRFKQRP